MRQSPIAGAASLCGGALGAAGVERALEAAINAHRQRVGLHPLQRNAALAAAARQHSERMRNLGFFSHVDPRDGTSVTERVEAVNGRGWRILAENLAAGYETAEQILHGWLGSPGHRRNLEHTGVSDFGTSVAFGGHMRSYVTQLYGSVGPLDLEDTAAKLLELRRRAASAAARCVRR